MNGIETHWGGVVIAIGNQKGGVGKTTVAVNLARGLADRGHRTLLWDLDPSAGATKHLGLVPDAFAGTYELLAGDLSIDEAPVTRDLNDAEHPWLPEHVDIIPSSRRLECIDQSLHQQYRFRHPSECLMEPVRRLRERYDFIVLDTPPSTVLSPAVSAYRVADWFLLVAMPDPLAITGLADAVRDIHAVRRHGNANLRLLGVVLNAADQRTRLARSLLAYVDRAFGTESGETLRLDPVISRSTVVPTSQRQERALIDCAPTHPVAEQFQRLTGSIESRLIAFQKGLADELTWLGEPAILERSDGGSA